MKANKRIITYAFLTVGLAFSGLSVAEITPNLIYREVHHSWEPNSTTDVILSLYSDTPEKDTCTDPNSYCKSVKLHCSWNKHMDGLNVKVSHGIPQVQDIEIKLLGNNSGFEATGFAGYPGQQTILFGFINFQPSITDAGAPNCHVSVTPRH